MSKAFFCWKFLVDSINSGEVEVYVNWAAEPAVIQCDHLSIIEAGKVSHIFMKFSLIWTEKFIPAHESSFIYLVLIFVVDYFILSKDLFF